MNVSPKHLNLGDWCWSLIPVVLLHVCTTSPATLQDLSSSEEEENDKGDDDLMMIASWLHQTSSNHSHGALQKISDFMSQDALIRDAAAEAGVALAWSISGNLW